MTWFRVDDKLHDHPKLRKLRDRKLPALGLWTACGSWSGDNLTDGFVPTEIVQRFDPDEGLAKRLVEVGLWVQVEVDDEPGYQFHQWTEHQPTKAEVERKRAEARERMRKRREGSSSEPPVTTGVRSQEVRANTPGSAREVRHPDPTRPDPSRPEKKKETAASRGTRIPDDFAVTTDMRDWARTNTPLVGQAETEQFIDYWRAESGSKAVKLDWVATWRRWMRTEQKRVEQHQTRPLRALPGGRVPRGYDPDGVMRDPNTGVAIER